MKTSIPQFRIRFRLLFFALLPLWLSPAAVRAQRQQVAVSGTVISQTDNRPLPGVTVLVEGTTIGTTTDSAGD